MVQTQTWEDDESRPEDESPQESLPEADGSGTDEPTAGWVDCPVAALAVPLVLVPALPPPRPNSGLVAR
jgi:hypothetical protein